MSDLDDYREDKLTPKITKEYDALDRHGAMMNAIAPYVKPVQKNLEGLKLVNTDKNTKVMMIMLPEWAPEFPPFNVARLAAVAEASGYQIKCLDLNIKAYNYLHDKYDIKSVHHPEHRDPELNAIIDYDPWCGTREWKWTNENYYTSGLHDLLKDFFETFIDDIVDYAPDVVGFTVYYCNKQPTEWFAKRLKERLPNVKILQGGPDAHKDLQHYDPIWDYIVRGEGEHIFLDILDEIENGITHDETQFLAQPLKQRLDLSNFPMPKYDDFDFNEYMIPNGVCSEFSRGCTAKCTFCEETHFWNYRQRQAVDALTEVKTLYETKGTNVIWFIDSLVNGNLQELRAFCKGVIAAGMDIHWTGYGRCNGKMDLEYYQDLAKAGCVALNYGIESGSQPVLDAIDKGVTVQEMEQNLNDGTTTGVKAFTNWIMGFPTEEYSDCANTMTFLWRVRNCNLSNIAAGFGFGLGMNSVVGQNPGKFGVLDHKYLDGVITHDFKLSKFHILVRMKSFYIFVRNLISEHDITIPYRPNIDNNHMSLEFTDPDICNEIEYENFDYDIIKPGISPFADSLVNEIWPLLRMLWRVRGGYKLRLEFSEELDMIEYGDRNAGPYWATHEFEITPEGKWKADFTYKFEQPPPELVKMPRLPFFAQDYSRDEVNSSFRARKIAKPTEWDWEGRNHDQFIELIEEEKILNRTIDFSFEYAWQGQGDWSGELDIVPVEDIKSEKFKYTTRKRSDLLPARVHHYPIQGND